VKIGVYTSLTGAYLPNGRILAESVKAIHPDWDMVLLYNDRTIPGINWEQEPFDHIVFAENLPIGRPWYRWAYDYSVVEFCTATKGVMAEHMLDVLGYDAVIYLDPDTLVVSPLEEVIEILSSARADVILTPHLTDPEVGKYAIWSHEMAALKHGTFNLGFYAIANRPNGRRYLRWWAERLIDYSHIDFDRGLFTDQKWANLAPYMFDGIHVLTDRCYNVATWNMTNRNVGRDANGTWTVNGKPIRFYHFSGFGNEFAWADSELANLAPNDLGLKALWEEYKALYDKHALRVPAPPWYWGVTADGFNITPEMRKKMREMKVVNPYRERIS
jgi:hypothetical protein